MDVTKYNNIFTNNIAKIVKPYPIQLGAIKGINVDTILDVDTSALIICSSRIPRLIKAKYAQNFCATSFDDIIDTTLTGAITEEIAELITNFVRNLDNSVEKLYIACDGGDSRSPAIAASILLASGRNDDCIWDNPFYYPNPLVYYRMCKAFGIDMTFEKASELRHRNEYAYHQAQLMRGETTYKRWELIL
ncbi:MAG: hypothetical protein IJM14_10115 [Lachnospiraceae bacterium]|nr:hypothetical protein [Lachnospiraceae bacterium]